MKMVRERILADGELQYREVVNAVFTCCKPLAVRRTLSGVAGGCQMDSACRAMHYGGGGGGRRGSSLFRGLNYTDPCTISFRFFLTQPLSNAGLHPLALALSAQELATGFTCH